MKTEQRKLSIVTSLGKRYAGMIDVPNASLRTTDLFNTANVYWKNPHEKCYDNAILMYDVELYIDDDLVYKKFDKIQVKLSEIIYFYDHLESIGDEKEKARAAVMIQQTQEEVQMVDIITKVVSNSFYHIRGSFHGLFKKKSKDMFVPLTEAIVVEIHKEQDRWAQKKIPLPHHFICMGNQHVESVTIG